MTNFNRNPYYDDFNEDKEFYRVLFRPGFAVQARELTQSQTILQNQISRFGTHVFKEGAMVIPGQSSIDTEYNYVKVADTFNSVDITAAYLNSLIGKTVVGSVTGVKAQVINYVVREGTDPITLFVKYTDSGTSQGSKTFSNTVTEVLVPEGILNRSLQTTSAGSTGTNINFVGVGSAASIERGVYYVQGLFALVKKQTIILDKYTNTPTYSIGLSITDDFVTPEEDETLLDNAEGSFNFSAPGAHRYRIVLTLTKRTPESVVEGDVNYVQVLRVENGKVQQKVDQSEYNILEQTLARRTFDESGNYVVRNFGIDIREFRSNDRGPFVQNSFYMQGDVVTIGNITYTALTRGIGTASPATATYDAVGRSTATGVIWEKSTTPRFNRGIYTVNNQATEATNLENDAKLAIGIEPGKAYVNGFELKREGTEFLTVPKAREFVFVNSRAVPSTVGSYILVTNLNYVPSIKYSTIDLYDRFTIVRGAPSGSKVGTARVRYIELDSGTLGSTSAVYKLGLFDIKLNNNTLSFTRNVKSFAQTGGTVGTTFTSSIARDDSAIFQLTGSVNIPALAAAASGTFTGTGTLFTLELTVGDYFIDNSSNSYLVTAIASNNSLTATATNASTATSGVVVYRSQVAIYEAAANSLVFPLPDYAVKSTRDTAGVNDTSYYISREFDVTTNGSGSVTLSVSGNESFGDPAEKDFYLITKKSDGSILNYAGSRTTNSVTLTTAAANEAVKIIAVIRVVGAEKSKTLNRTSFLIPASKAAGTVLKLNKADGSRLVSVFMSTQTGVDSPVENTYTIDVTDNYAFTDGQTSTHYDLSYIELIAGAPRASGSLKVIFEYFEHGNGDYFSVDSYASIKPEFIPSFGSLSLRDAIDFRPRISDDGLSFIGTGSSLTGTPKRGEDLVVDYSFYLGRKDKIFFDQKGKYVVNAGKPGVNPSEPSDLIDSIHLYTIELEPYTRFNKNSVYVSTIDNRRYTMRDIAGLERRIDSLEYYTSLSLLEQDTNSLKITDDLGFDRFKNGFFVDNFSTFAGGFVESLDHSVSIDTSNNYARPSFSMQNVKLVEAVSTVAQRDQKKYTVTGELLTLPYTETLLVEQAACSRVENINPFAIFSFLGNARLTPETDEWFETKRAPDVIQNVEGNFAATKRILGGTLGVAWNSWQTNWSGVISSKTQSVYAGGSAKARAELDRAGVTQISVAELQDKIGRNIGGGGGAARKITEEITVTQSNQSRTGIKTSIIEKFDRQVIDDRTINTEVIPYIRSRNVLYLCRGLKPNTRFYPFFDGVDVSRFITTATKISVFNPGTTLKFTGKFDTTTNAGANANEKQRRIGGATNTDSAFSNGDVVYVQTRGTSTFTSGNTGLTPAYGVVVLQETGVNETVLHLVNVVGTFQAGDILAGSISGVTAKFGELKQASATGGSIVTNFNGDTVGVFNIPSTDAVRFRTGTREFKLTDSTTNGNDFTSNVRKGYTAKGTLETRQQTIRSTRNAEIVREQVNENRTIFTQNQRVLSDTGWYDPIAQTFLVQSDGGAFLTSIDIFFASKDERIPVQLDIREVVNGYPGKTILPFSKVVLTPDQVNLATTFVTLSEDEFGGKQFASPTVATRFTFPSPVYVQNGAEYCIVLVSDSNAYNVWISELGERQVGTDKIISEQPYAGVFFKSQNASTWTANQEQDLKFRINKAVFNTNDLGVPEFVNDALPYDDLRNNPFTTKLGSNKVRVDHIDHNMFPGSKVEIVGATDGNGFTAANMNTTHTIVSIENDSYVIQLSSNATFTGTFGGSVVQASSNVSFSTVNVTVQQNVFSDTEINYLLKTTPGSSIANTNSVSYILSGSTEPIPVNDNVEFFDPKVVASKQNEVNAGKTMSVQAIMKTSNPNISPVIDLARISAICVANKVNNPTVEMNVAGLDDATVVSSNTFISVANNRYETTDANTINAIKTMEIGKYINITGFAAAGNNGEKLITNISDDGKYFETFPAPTTPVAAGASVSIIIRDRFVDEIAPFGSSSYSKYLTKKINFTNQSTALTIKFAADIMQNADVAVYYRTDGDSRNSFETTPFIKINPSTPLVKNNDGEYYDADYNLKDLPSYKSAQIKIVLLSNDDAEVPKIRDLRVIGLA